MPTANFKEKPILAGEKVQLRPFEESDGNRMLKILAEVDVQRLTGSVHNDQEALKVRTDEEKQKVLAWYSSRNAQEDRLDLAIVDMASGQIVGEAVFNEYEEYANNASFRILIGSDGQGKGLGTEAIALFLKYGFEKLGLNRIWLEVYSFNPRAERVYIKSGFVLEGVRREDFKYDGQYIDTKIYGMLRSDYEFTKKAGI
ncbi:GNAT family N-acetyltransferase [Saccharibacillus sp. JS10]|uniref:GNAT family N-acetyltransferase n=1 Tax=Saccharibacillus sp. JS10 TaxID=2950552 RepID=UPI00210F171C|nr:GNAT family protein [Saccharibacillus sp. JS10]MCQ4085383.1 GNAT family N-acetyltransferase [Saccharibacillus sp. JS10]